MRQRERERDSEGPHTSKEEVSQRRSETGRRVPCHSRGTTFSKARTEEKVRLVQTEALEMRPPSRQAAKAKTVLKGFLGNNHAVPTGPSAGLPPAGSVTGSPLILTVVYFIFFSLSLFRSLHGKRSKCEPSPAWTGKRGRDRRPPKPPGGIEGPSSPPSPTNVAVTGPHWLSCAGKAGLAGPLQPCDQERSLLFMSPGPHL